MEDEDDGVNKQGYELQQHAGWGTTCSRPFHRMEEEMTRIAPTVTETEGVACAICLLETSELTTSLRTTTAPLD